ncbi:MAG: hypothetical protein WDO24_10905 [Pseudomonadota bacterium]
MPFPPGAGPDQIARLISQDLGEALGQAIVVDNKSGGARHDRRQRGRARRARRLHPADDHQHGRRGGAGAGQESALRSGQGFRADHPPRHLADDPARSSRSFRPTRSRNSSPMQGKAAS